MQGIADLEYRCVLDLHPRHSSCQSMSCLLPLWFFVCVWRQKTHMPTQREGGEETCSCTDTLNSCDVHTNCPCSTCSACLSLFVSVRMDHFDCLEQVSKVRSLTMDHWSHTQVLQMLEGSNDQLWEFFTRYALGARTAGFEGNAFLKPKNTAGDLLVWGSAHREPGVTLWVFVLSDFLCALSIHSAHREPLLNKDRPGNQCSQ